MKTLNVIGSWRKDAVGVGAHTAHKELGCL